MKTPGYVVLHLYHAGNKKHEQYHALVLSSREDEGKKFPVLTVVYFDHLDTASHHSLNGVDYADTLERVFDVPHIEDAEGQAFYYEDQVGALESLAMRYFDLNSEKLTEIARLQAELVLLKAQLSETTEGKNKALQALADEHAVNAPRPPEPTTEN